MTAPIDDPKLAEFLDAIRKVQDDYGLFVTSSEDMDVNTTEGDFVGWFRQGTIHPDTFWSAK